MCFFSFLDDLNPAESGKEFVDKLLSTFEFTDKDELEKLVEVLQSVKKTNLVRGVQRFLG